MSGAAARRWDLLHSGAYDQKPAARSGRAQNWGPCLALCRDDLGVGRGDLSDDRWAVLGPLVPVAVLGRPSGCRLRLIDGIRRRVRTGAPWRDLPAEYGPWQTVYGLFRRWQRDGTWALVSTGLQTRADAAGLTTWEVNVGSTLCRAQHAAGARRAGQARKEPPGGSRAEPDDHGLGRSRGGGTTKVQLACEQGQKPLSLLVTAGQRGDGPQFTAVLEAARAPAWTDQRPTHLRIRRTRHARTARIRVVGEAAARFRNRPRSGRPPQTPGSGWRVASSFRS